MGKQELYLERVATNIMGQVGFKWGMFSPYANHDSDNPNYPNVLWQETGQAVLVILRKMNSETRGRIIASETMSNPHDGLTSYYDVNECKDLKAAPSGDEVLTLLAGYVVVAAIADIVRDHIQFLRAEHALIEDGLGVDLTLHIHNQTSGVGQAQ